MTKTALVAIDPRTMETAHDHLLERIETNYQTTKADLADLRGELERARERKWATTALAREVRKREKHLVFLEKVRGAVEAGYRIIPDLDLQVIAQRMDVEGKVPTGTDSYRFTVGAERLPAKGGEYVSPEPEFISYTVTKENGHTQRMYQATAYAPVDVPFMLVERGLADVLHGAMQQKLFDEIGIVLDQRKGDPVLVGRIRHPKDGGYGRRGIMFFLGWWFNERDLEL